MSNEVSITSAPRGLFRAKLKLTPDNMSNLRLFPGFSKWIGREFHFRPSGDCFDFWDEHFSPLLDDQEVSDQWHKHYETKRIAAENLANREAEFFDDSGYEYARPPMEHQGRAFAISRQRALYAYFMEQGTGKTKVTIDNAAWLYEQGEIDCLLIVAWPNGVHRQWIDDEVPADLPKRIPHKAAFWNAEQNTKAKAAEIDAVLNCGRDLAIMSFNAEAFSSARAKECIEAFLRQRRCMFVIDQSACIKNWNAKRTKYLIKLSKQAEYKRILDGDPATEGAQELFAQMYFLDPLIVGCDTWTNFKATYCRVGRFDNVIGYVNLPELMSKIDPYVFRAREAECLDIPKRRYRRWPFDLTSKERRIFDQFREKDFAEFEPDTDEDGVMEVNLAIVKNTRLQQIASGWFHNSDTGELKAINTGKSSRQAAFENWVAHIGKDKAIIFARFKPDIFALEKLLGDRAVSYHGRKTSDEKAEAKHRFMNDDSVQFIVGQQSTLSIGHTLTKAKHVAFYTNNPSLRFRTEAEKRAHRNGLQNTLAEDEHLQIWDFIANKTTDQNTMISLRQKRDLATVIMNDPISFFLVEEEIDDE